MLTYWCWSCLSSCFPCRSSECDGVTLCDTSWQLVTDGEWSGGSKTRSASQLTPQWLPDYGAHHSPLRTAFRKYFHFKFSLSHAQGALLICSTFKYLEYLPALADRLVIWAVLTFAIICPFYHPDIWHWIWNQNYLVLCRSGPAVSVGTKKVLTMAWNMNWPIGVFTIHWSRAGQQTPFSDHFCAGELGRAGPLGHPDTTELQGAKLVLSICLNCLGNVGKTTLPVNAKNFHSLIFLNSKQEIDSLMLVNISIIISMSKSIF